MEQELYTNHCINIIAIITIIGRVIAIVQAAQLEYFQDPGNISKVPWLI